MRLRFSPAHCCCGGATSCTKCDDGFDAATGVYTSGQTIPGACSLVVTTGLVIVATAGKLTTSSTTRLTSAVSMAAGAKYCQIHADFTLGSKLRIFLDMDATSSASGFYAEIEAKAMASGGNRWVLRIIDGATITSTDLGGGSFTGSVSDLLIEVCRTGGADAALTLHVPFLGASVSGQKFGKSNAATTGVILEGLGSVILGSLKVATDGSDSVGCPECGIEYNATPCSQCTDVVPSVLLDLPAMSSSSPACVGSIPCSALQGRYRLFRKIAPASGSGPGCVWSVGVPRACYSPDVPEDATLALLQVEIASSTSYAWLATLSISSSIFGETYIVKWKGPTNAGVNTPILCGGQTVTLPFLSFSRAGGTYGCTTAGSAVLTT